MINISLRLNLPATVEQSTVVTVFHKSRNNIIGTCTIEQDGSGSVGTLAVAEEPHNDLYVFYIYAAIEDKVVLEGILLDDTAQNKAVNKLGAIKQG